MASKRKLKKTVHFVTDELIIEMYILSLFKKMSDEKLNEITNKALTIKDDFILRINHVDGKEDSKIVKSYFKKLREDWANAIDELVTEIEQS